ncbi:hypothetical protein SAMN04487900_10162 [Prevotella communis]|uniref:Uncharacterized protein n=1 Tax=Prevotella communis TaxID=2913614 RepID=A0A1H0CRT0_9BACT|nr:hypothetical protein SAMN04487900_10162 [Prevotella communis]
MVQVFDSLNKSKTCTLDFPKILIDKIDALFLGQYIFLHNTISSLFTF